MNTCASFESLLYFNFFIIRCFYSFAQSHPKAISHFILPSNRCGLASTGSININTFLFIFFRNLHDLFLKNVCVCCTWFSWLLVLNYLRFEALIKYFQKRILNGNQQFLISFLIGDHIEIFKKSSPSFAWNCVHCAINSLKFLNLLPSLTVLLKTISNSLTDLY